MLTIAVEPDAKIGDTLLKEPALSAWARTRGERVNLWVPYHLRFFFAGHPDFTLLDERPEEFTPLHAWIAMEQACAKGAYFSTGYWHQLGMDAPGPWDRTGIKVYGAERSPPNGAAVVCPFAESCRGRREGPPNIMPPLDWWGPIVSGLGCPVVSLGSADDPPIPETANLRGWSLSHVLKELSYARAVIAVETGLLHMASAVTDRVVFLSCATPPTLCAPPGSGWRVVRAMTPDQFDVAEVLTAAREVGR